MKNFHLPFSKKKAPIIIKKSQDKYLINNIIVVQKAMDIKGQIL